MDLRAKRCPADHNGGTCGSAIFYDWGLQILSSQDSLGVSGAPIDRWRDFGTTQNVKICARCTTPFLIEGGELFDISDELGAEDVKAILTRGQATLPHVKIKDP